MTSKTTYPVTSITFVVCDTISKDIISYISTICNNDKFLLEIMGISYCMTNI